MDLIIKSIQEIIKQSIDVSKFSDVVFGEVIEVDPIKIKINEYITLEEENLYLTNAVKDHEIDVSVSWNTEDTTVNKIDSHTHSNVSVNGVGNMGAPVSSTGIASKSSDIDSTHKHEIKDKKKMIVHNALKKEEKVILIKCYGGQRYIVIDRISDFEPEGEWLD